MESALTMHRLEQCSVLGCLSRRLRYPALAILRVVLGSIFVYAGANKIQADHEFLAAIQAYELLPSTWAPVFTAVVPWIEVVAGGALIVGAYLLRGAFAVGLVLTGLFIVAQASAIGRGLEIGCGCFDVTERESLVGAASVGRTSVIFLAFACGLLICRQGGEKVCSGGGEDRSRRSGRDGAGRERDHHKYILRGLLLGILLSPGMASAAQDDRNAASWYERAAAELKTMSENDWQQIERFLANPHADPSPDIVRALQSAQNAIQYVYRGTQQSDAFWSERPHGFSAPNPPQLYYLRDLAKVVQADALVKMHQGQSAESAAAIGSLYQLSRHAAQSHTTTSSMLAMRLFANAEKAADQGFDTGAFAPSDAATILRAVRDFDDLDPFHTLSALVVAYESTQESVLQLHATGDFDTIEAYFDVFDSDVGDLLRSLDEDEMAEMSRRSYEFMDEVVGAALLPDQDDARRAVESLIEDAKESGDILLLPWFEQINKLVQSMHYAENAVDERAASLREIVRGQSDAAALRNAAVLYLEAIRRSASLRARLFEDSRLTNADGSTLQIALADLDDVTNVALSEVIDRLRSASLLKRCDFATALGVQEKASVGRFLPDHLLGMRQLLMIVLADARRHAASDDSEVAGKGVTDRLEIALGMVFHLGSNGPLMSSVIAHDGLSRVAGVLEDIGGVKILADGSRNRLILSLDRFPPIDPLGYRNSIEKTRGVLAEHVRSQVEPAARPKVEKTIRVARPEQLLRAVIFFDARRRRIADQTDSTLTPRADFFNDIIDTDVLRRMIEELFSEAVIESVRGGDWSRVFHRGENPVALLARWRESWNDIEILREVVEASPD